MRFFGSNWTTFLVVFLFIAAAVLSCKSENSRPQDSLSSRTLKKAGHHPDTSETKDKNKPALPAKNMVVIIVDTLRADRLGCYGFKEPTSPTIDDWAREGVLFEQMHAASPWTAPSFGTLFTGVSPTVHGAGTILAKGSPKGNLLFGVTISGLRQDLPTLSSLLPKNVLKAAIVTNSFLSKEIGFDRGFDYFDHRNAGFDVYRTADQVSELAVQWLEKNHSKPFFLLLHYFDPHMSYNPPTAYVEMFAPNKPKRISVPFADNDAARTGKLKPNEDEKRFIKGLYNGEVRFVDDQLALLEEEMKKLGLMENTWIVLTSDHGEEHFEHGGFEHGHAYEEEVIRVPLIIRAPGGKWRAGARVGSVVRMVDIPPTILALFKAPIPEDFEGTSLLELIEGKEIGDRTVYSEFNLFGGQSCSLFDGRYKIVWNVWGKRGFYYDLKEDPFEQTRKSSDDPIYADLYKKLQALREDLENKAKGKPRNKATLSKEAIDALKGLGYI